MRRRIAIVLVAACLAACTSESPHALPAQTAPRIVTLAPHLTELVFTAGAGDKLVGVVAHSDFPPAARELPVIGDAFRIDPERLAEVEPDLILAWDGGNPEAVIDQLVSRGYRVARLRTDTLTDVAANLVEIGGLAGRSETANSEARNFLRGLSDLRAQYAGARRLSVFYQIAPRPLYTVGGRHPISEMIDLCGGRNLFADLEQLAPVVSLEEVVARNPDVIIASADDAQLDRWRRWGALQAVVHDSLYTVDASLVTRPGMRMLDGIEAICAHIDRSRAMAAAADELLPQGGG